LPRRNLIIHSYTKFVTFSLVVNWILEKVFSLLDSIFLSFLRWGKIFPLFGELLLTTTPHHWNTSGDGESFNF